MKKRIFRPVILGLLLSSLAFGSVAYAQDFDTNMANAFSLTQQMLSQIVTAQGAADVAGMRAGAQTALATGQQAAAALEAARAAATTDANRSRAEGLLQHIQAANLALTQAQTVPDGEVAARLNAARAEVEEALVEFPPIRLPEAGDPVSPEGLALAAMSGLGLLALGVTLRRYQPARL